MTNHDFYAFLKNNFLAGKLAATLAPEGLGSQDPTKKLANRMELLGQPLPRKNDFENLGPETPP